MRRPSPSRGAAVLVAVAMAIAAGFGRTAAAQGSVADPTAICFEGTGNPELDIHYCSLAIEASESESMERATLLALRGRAYNRVLRHDRAIADFDLALRLNPLSALALNNRGLALHAKGDYGSAIGDFDAAIALFPRYYDAFRNRGTARFFADDVKAAAADYDDAIGIYARDPGVFVLRGLARYFADDSRAAVQDLETAQRMSYAYPYLDLWLFLARRADGSNGREALRASLDAWETDAWPRPLVDRFLGRASTVEVLAALAAMPAPFRAMRAVATRFFLAEHDRLEGMPVAARRHLEAALAADGPRPIEWAGAKAALARLEN